MLESRKADTMHNLTHDVLPDTHYEPRHQAYRKRHQKIKINSTKLENGEITIANFLDRMAEEDDEILFYSTDDDDSEYDTDYNTDDEWKLVCLIFLLLVFIFNY